MSLVESVGAIFDRLLTARMAATAALASFILLLVSAALIYLQLSTQLTEFPKVGDPKFLTVIASNVNHTLVTATATFFIILVTALCSLTVGLLIGIVRLLKESLLKLFDRANRDLRKLERAQRGQPTKEDEAFKEWLMYVRITYPYFLILYDLIFYICLGLIVLAIALVLLVILAISPIIPYIFGILIIVVVIGAVVEGIVGWTRGASKKATGIRKQRRDKTDR